MDEQSPPTRPAEHPSNRDWLTRHARAHAGQWVALCNGTLVAHGARRCEVTRKLAARGIAEHEVWLVRIGHDATS